MGSKQRGAKVSKNSRLFVFARDDYTCQGDCGQKFDPPVEGLEYQRYVHGNHLTIDHIIPKAFGGSNLRKNLRAMCYDCNSALSAETSKEINQTRGKKR